MAHTPPLQEGSGKMLRGQLEGSLRASSVFFNAVIVVFLAVLLYVLKAVLSPLLIGAALVLTLVCMRRGIPVTTALALVVILLLLAWLLSEVGDLLLPFILSFVLAYIFNPLVRLLAKKMPRTLAIFLIVLVILGILVGVGALLIPRIGEEAEELGSRIPGYVEKIKDWYQGILGLALKFRLDLSSEGVQQWILEKLPQLSQKVLKGGVSGLRRLTSGVYSGIKALVSLLIIPFVTFYFLKDYDKIRGKVESMLPQSHASSLQSLFHEINDVVGKYLRGKLFASLFVGLLTSFGLLLSGIEYSFILGMTAGVLNLIPYVGISTAFVVSCLVAVLGTSPWFSVLKVAIVFGVVQAIEENVIEPRIVGGQVGLHPLWVIFALLFFTHFWGFLGLLIAIPTAAIIKVVAMTLLGRYYGSQILTDESDRSQAG